MTALKGTDSLTVAVRLVFGCEDQRSDLRGSLEGPIRAAERCDPALRHQARSGEISRDARQLHLRGNHRPRGAYYLVGLEFTDIEFAGHHARFTGQMFGTVPIPGLALGVSTFFMEELAFHIPEGMQMTWVTTMLK